MMIDENINHVLNLINSQLATTMKRLESEENRDMRDYRAGYLNGLEMAKTILSDWGFYKEDR